MTVANSKLYKVKIFVSRGLWGGVGVGLSPPEAEHIFQCKKRRAKAFFDVMINLACKKVSFANQTKQLVVKNVR